MKKIILSLIAFFLICALNAQSVITGIISESNGSPVASANIILKASYDGGSTDSSGRFRFVTSEKGNFTLLITAMGYQKDSVSIILSGTELVIHLTLLQEISELNTVTISAGTLETGDHKKGAVLNSLDIATTAGAVADVVAALQTLPGTAQAFGENGLFVRGGSGAETQSYFDGMM
ncbi:MAG: carboxypeptidase-like regulatory domain-containing protein, partial [Chitinophagaceae bacterium]